MPWRRSVAEAMAQIRARGYADKYANAGKEIILLGVGLSEAEKNIGDWTREELHER